MSANHGFTSVTTYDALQVTFIKILLLVMQLLNMFPLWIQDPESIFSPKRHGCENNYALLWFFTLNSKALE